MSGPSTSLSRCILKRKTLDTKIFPAGAISRDAKLKYSKLSIATGDDSRDFATWSGDLGQTYADYLGAKYVSGAASASLAAFIDAVATTAELTADIHCYIATQVSTDARAYLPPVL